MCDTLVALGNSTKDGSVIFAKNSDRQPNEPHLMIRVPRRTYPQGARVKCTYIEIDQVQETYEVLLLKPSWMWGAEMGCNEFGLNIGNEAVFTKVKQGPPSLLGMDMVRLALERCQTSTEALHYIIGLLETYGQGGNCGYEKPFVYHNSFLIADKTSAWVLETAGPYWAAEKVKDIRCISNRLSIGKDFDLAHPELISHAMNQGWCRSEEDFHFAKCYSNRLYSSASGSKERFQSCMTHLEKHKGQITVETMMEILRYHEPRIAHRPFAHSSLRSVCMHGGFIVGDHTTGSYVASLGEGLSTYWITGSSTPCISTFKPFWMIRNTSSIVFGENEQEEALAFWMLRERLHRMILENRVLNLEEYIHQRDELEKELLAMVSELEQKEVHENEMREIMEYGWSKERILVEQTIGKNRQNPGRIQGNPYFRRYWKKQNKRLGL